ncbi:RHS repeat-associated core domain-containing protein [Chryseobacterium rhizosphaerae]|uniref:RHS repeat-associated core domain-containing protein n=1 Tax=Chryseobacterium rhizosphaerae TaxID=395937 RepID=UPI00235A376D|nr:RHS repeat-associated core domain-containing protein [Chryseobacterium rhizosphaerae]MDC8099814.1 FG-GAP-like repeat-containing protein [Chryseobacterium rhizosphaerae]
MFGIGLFTDHTVSGETTSRTVQDPQTVVLAQGFHAKSDVSNPFIAKIGPSTENSGGGPVDSNAGANNPSGTSSAPGGQSFHDTKGNIEVNGAGQLQFTLPIALPPGVKSVAPQINLVYTSGAENGIAGYAWNLSGLTAISRIGKNIEKDGEVKGVQLDYSDYYSFNGQRLILKSGEYGKDGAEYVTEKYSNIKIRSVGSSQNISGPDYWEITFEDGSQAMYEKTFTNSSNGFGTPALEYNITNWKDVQGNYITYAYDYTMSSGFRGVDGGVSRISSIAWGGNEKLNNPHFNKIDFTYINRDLAEQSYVQGLKYTQDKLLSGIKVSSNGNQFKRYAIEYINNNTKYQFINKIREYNSKDESANPIIFENESDPQVTNVFRQDNRFDDIYEAKVSGDFNGDGKLDFIKGNTLMLGRLDGTGNFYTINYEGDLLNAVSYIENGILNTQQNLVTGKIEYLDKTLKLQFSGFDVTDSFVNKQTLSYDLSTIIPTLSNSSCSNNWGQFNFPPIITLSSKEGDFNGDGISDLLINVRRRIRCPRGMDVTWLTNLYIDYKNGIIKKLDENKTLDLISVSDFNGDGKSDLLRIENNELNVYSLNAQNDFIKISSTSKESFNNILYLGDFNGDGKTDVMAPIAEDSSDWRMYISTGTGFKKEYYSNLFLYKPDYTGAGTKYRNTVRTYATPDLNKDGKSDFIIFESQKWFRDLAVNNPDSSYGFNYLKNDGVDANGKPIFTSAYNIAPKELDWDGEDLNYSMYGEHYIPLFGSFRIAQLNTEFTIVHKTKLITWDLGSKLNVVSKIKTITQGGLKTDIEYSSLISSGDVYTSYFNTSPVVYPYVNITKNSNYNVVSRIIQGERKQEFRYRDLIGHLHGKGTIGFRQTARSTFFASGFENTKVWSGSEINPVNEGLPYKDWSVRTTDEMKIFPNDISLDNTQLLSFKQYQYKIDKLLNGNVVTTVANTDKPKIVLAINPYVTTSKDFLKNIKTVHTVEEYDNLYLPKKSVTNVNDGFYIKRSELEYYPSNITPGNNYSIGKPKIKTDIVQAYGDTKSAKEEYTYENNLLKTLKIENRDNTGYLQEAYIYDGFGNITQKTVSNSVDSQTQTTKADYDSKGRFVIRKTDNLGLQTGIVYNDWGQILTQVDPLGNILTNTYDNWGKLLTSKTNLAGTTTYQYEKDYFSNLIITQYDPDGDISKKTTNTLGQDITSSTKAFGQGYFVLKATQYDILGRKIKESEPFFEGQGASQWNTIIYDDSVFPAKITSTSFTGKQMETSVSGLTTTVKESNPTDYGRITTKTADALGNVISSTDKGGTITFSYNAAGEQIKAQYAENIITTKYDSWGRKSEFNDPSNGLYKYEYDGLGQPKKITSPKGTKEYTYNNVGQLITQKELSTTDGGQATDKTISYSYDDKGRLISKSGTSKGKAYSSNVSYDPQGRLLSSSESSNGKYFIQKGITYDDKARVISYEKQLYSSGTLTKVQIENGYSAWNGELYQVKDKISGKILWELQETNANGQLLKAKLGAANINNVYNTNGFLTNVNHSSQVKPGILQVSYTFDAIKNELKSRTTGGDFNIVESFDYDDNNRLVNWTNPVTGVKVQNATRNVYDAKGRILENDQVGKIKFDSSSKIYQPTGMTLNAAGTQNYNNDLVQSIVYNENNDPVFIDGMKGDVAFQYGLSGMRQRATYGGNFSTNGEGKFTKFYSENGSYEVVRDNTTGKEKHLIYIGGTPYESNIVYLKDFTESSGSYKFLHKDYIGSILAISDEAGNKLEQRHFDAWGNFTHLQIGNGAIVTDKNIIDNASLLVDRGYTSHEHFAEVGIIHMNGRLYDSLLRRFLNADENIQDPTNTQNYNKYGYVLNNPMMYNDPSGEFIWWLPLAVAVVSEGINMYVTQTPFSFDRFYMGLITSYVSASVASGIGAVFQAGGAIANSLSNWTIVAKAGAHAITQGTLSYMQGGNFWSGALSGTFASISNDLLGLAVDNVGENSILRSDGFALFNGAVSGGIGSVLGGGNFWIGAGQGLIVTTFNYLGHKISFKGIKFVDENNKVIAKYATKKYNAIVKIPHNIGKIDLDLNSIANPLSDVDIIGLGLGGDFTFAMGGGKSLEFIFFLDGANAGTWQTYTVQRGNVGIAGGYSIYGIVGDFHKDSLLDANAYTEYSFSSTTEIKGVVGGSVFWAPKDYPNDRFGIKSFFDQTLRAWSGYNISAGVGGGAQLSRNFTSFYKK